MKEEEENGNPIKKDGSFTMTKKKETQCQLVTHHAFVDGHFVLAYGENPMERFMYSEHHRACHRMNLSTLSPIHWGVFKTLSQCLHHCTKPCVDNSHLFIPTKGVEETTKGYAAPIVGPDRA